MAAMRLKSLSAARTVSPTFSAVAAMSRSGIDGVRCWPRSARSICTSSALSSMAGVRCSTGIKDKGGEANCRRPASPERAE
jgi:hypothetical protein